MERRQAMALAAAGALLGAAAVAAGTSGLLHEVGDAATGSIDFGQPSAVADEAASATSPNPVVVTETRDVYDTIVVSAPRGGAPPGPDVEDDTSGGSSPPKAGSGLSSGGTTTTAPPSPPTTHSGGTTTTTRPPGVPDDWPADQPIPPMPPGCQKPQLEDDGHWNCDH